MLGYLVLMTFPVAMAFAAANDLFTMRIPNRISLVLIAGFVAAALLTRMPLETFGIHLATAFALLVATFTLFSFNLLGGGDAKLMAAGALWMGGAHILEFVLLTAIVGGALCLIILGYRNFVPAGAFPLPGWAHRLHTKGGPIPYGIAISAAGLLLFPSTELFRLLAV